MKPITLYTNPQSRGSIVRWLLEELELTYDTKVLEYGPQMKSADYLAINAMGKVPALVHGDTVVTETAAICMYLADQFTDKQLAPALTSPQRGNFLRWMFFAAGPLEMAITAKAFNWRIDDDNAQAVGCGHYDDTLDVLEQELWQKPYLCGEFSAADVYIAANLHWGMQFNTIASRPAFIAYTERLAKRPAALRATELDNAQLTP